MAINGVQNNLDIQNYVAQIMQYEREPLTALETRKSTTENKISAWSDINKTLKSLQTALKKLQQAATFLTKKATSSNTAIITATGSVNSAETAFTFSDITLATAASTKSTASIGLLSGVAASITSSGEIIAGAGSINPNTTIGNLVLDPGKSIVSGSFYVNNKKITVDSNDTVYTILSKINSAGANVTATLSDDRISITQDTKGISYSVRLRDDTTGFFSAMKLAEGSEDPEPAYGTDSDYLRKLRDTAIGGLVQNGYININNITISVDVNSDSLSNVINKINSSAAGVTAYYDAIENKITLTSKEDGKDIALSNDTANLFSALNISTGTYSGTPASFRINGGEPMTRNSNTFELNGTTFTLRSGTSAGESVSVNVEMNQEAIETAIEDFVDKYNKVINDINAKSAKGEPLERDRKLQNIIRRLRTLSVGSIENDSSLTHLSQIGITIDHQGKNSSLNLSKTKLSEALKNNVQDVFSLFAVDSTDNGRYTDAGLSVTLDNYLNDFTHRFSGYIVKHSDFLRNSMTRLDTRIERMETRLDRREKALIEEMQKMQDAVSKLDSRSYSAMTVINQFS